MLEVAEATQRTPRKYEGRIMIAYVIARFGKLIRGTEAGGTLAPSISSEIHRRGGHSIVSGSPVFKSGLTRRRCHPATPGFNCPLMINLLDSFASNIRVRSWRSLLGNQILYKRI